MNDKSERNIYLILTVITFICLLNSFGNMFNSIGVRRVNNKLGAVARTIEILHDVEKPGEYNCKSIDTPNDDVVSRVLCENKETMYETWTYADGKVDIVVNGE